MCLVEGLSWHYIDFLNLTGILSAFIIGHQCNSLLHVSSNWSFHFFPMCNINNILPISETNRISMTTDYLRVYRQNSIDPLTTYTCSGLFQHALCIPSHHTYRYSISVAEIPFGKYVSVLTLGQSNILHICNHHRKYSPLCLPCPRKSPSLQYSHLINDFDASLQLLSVFVRRFI